MSIPSAPTQEASNTATAGASTLVLTVGAVAAGNTLFATYFASAGDKTVSSITQTNVTWTVQQVTAGTSQIISLWMGVVSGGSSGTTVTMNLSGSLVATALGHVSEWAGAYTRDAHNTIGATTDANPRTGTITPTASQNQLMIGCARRGGTFSSGPTNGWTAFNTSSATRPSAYLVVGSTTGTYSTDWTFTAALVWESLYATFSQASSGPTGAVTGTAVAAAAAQELLAGGAVGVSLATASAQDLVAAVATGIAAAAASGQELAMGVSIGSAVSTADAQELLGATAVGIASLSADSAGNGGAVSGTASLAASALELLLGAVVGDGTVQATADGGAAVGGTGPGRGGYLHELRWRKKLEEAEEAARIAEQAEIDATIAEQQATSHASIAAKAAAREARIVARAAAAAAHAAEAEAERIRAEKQLLDDEDDIRLVYWLTAY